MDLARRPAPLDGDGLALSKQRVTRTRSRPHPSPSPDRVRGGRPPPRPAAPFSMAENAMPSTTIPAVSGRTGRKLARSTRGKSVESVRDSVQALNHAYDLVLVTPKERLQSVRSPYLPVTSRGVRPSI